MEIFGYEIYSYQLVKGSKILAYSLHFKKEKAKSHLKKIVSFHNINGEITEDFEENVWENILSFLESEKQSIFSIEDLKKYSGWKVYEYLVNSGKKLHTYSEISRNLGISIPTLIKILAHNPFLILIPCHRIIRKDGKLSGYTPLGKDFKRILLKIEGLYNEDYG